MSNPELDLNARLAEIESIQDNIYKHVSWVEDQVVKAVRREVGSERAKLVMGDYPGGDRLSRFPFPPTDPERPISDNIIGVRPGPFARSDLQSKLIREYIDARGQTGVAAGHAPAMAEAAGAAAMGGSEGGGRRRHSKRHRSKRHSKRRVSKTRSKRHRRHRSKTRSKRHRSKRHR